MTDALDDANPYAVPSPHAPPRRAYGTPDVTYGVQQYPVPHLQAPRLRAAATGAQVAVAANAVVALLLIWALLSRVSLVDDYVAAPTGDLTAIRASDDRVAALVTAQNVVFLCAAVVWIVWFYRARIAAEAYSNTALRFGRGWAIGSWLVPFLSFVRPVQMTGDILDTVRRPIGSIEVDLPGRTLMGWWWGTFLAGRLVLSFASIDQDDSVASLRTHSIWMSVALGVMVVAALLAVLLVQRITTASDRRRETAPTA